MSTEKVKLEMTDGILKVEVVGMKDLNTKIRTQNEMLAKIHAALTEIVDGQKTIARSINAPR